MKLPLERESHVCLDCFVPVRQPLRVPLLSHPVVFGDRVEHVDLVAEALGSREAVAAVEGALGVGVLREVEVPEEEAEEEGEGETEEEGRAGGAGVEEVEEGEEEEGQEHRELEEAEAFQFEGEEVEEGGGGEEEGR